MADTFTPEQISQILEEFFKVVGTRQYIGARYVPIFGRKDETSIEWDNSAPYEPLTIVLYQGNSYTSRQFVPVGVEITNQEFWAVTGNYNAQVEMYRRETAAAREIADNALAKANAAQTDIDTLLPKTNFSATNTVKKYVDDSVAGAKADAAAAQADIDTLLPKASFNATNTVKKYVDDSIATAQANTESLLPKSAFSASNTVKKYIDDSIAAIPSNAIDSPKILITDSYGMGTHAAGEHEDGDGYPQIIKDTYHIANLNHYGNGGAGFLVRGTSGTRTHQDLYNKNFYEMIEYAANSMSAYQRSLVTGVMFAGGYNDSANYDSANINSAIAKCCNYARAQFPNATIYVEYLFCGSIRNTTGNFSQCKERYVNQGTKFGANSDFCVNLPWILGGASNDTIHPNASGQQYLAGFIYSRLYQNASVDYTTALIQKDYIYLNGRTITVPIASTLPYVIRQPTPSLATMRDTIYTTAVYPNGHGSERVSHWAYPTIAYDSDGGMRLQNWGVPLGDSLSGNGTFFTAPLQLYFF